MPPECSHVSFRQHRTNRCYSITSSARASSIGDAIEEHYADPQLIDRFDGWRDVQPARIVDRLLDLGGLRLTEMDEAGIDVQVLSHAPPAIQMIEADLAVPLARHMNDFLCEAVRRHPRRFAGFATLPTADPKAAAEELERSVDKLGFKGTMVHGLTRGLFLDDKRFWPIFERAQALDVPIYLHPSNPHPAVIEAYYEDYPPLIRAGWGFGVETATQGMRLIISGVFDTYPDLKIILGHLGEGLPFLLWRSDSIITREAKLPKSVRDTFCSHFYLTTSGNFSTSALQCSLMEMGADHIIFSVDWPWASNVEGVEFIEKLPIDEIDR
jgi:predicted TIM-barrel fold metal-dependent hydrolase